MEYGWKEVPNIYFTTNDGILIGKNSVVKNFQEFYDGIDWKITTKSPLIDIDLFETLLSTTCFDIYINKPMKRRTDGKTVNIWYAYYNSEINSSFREASACDEPCEFIDEFHCKVREYISEKDLPEDIKEDLK